MRAGTRILVVDDDLATRVRIRDVLERDTQLSVQEAEDGYIAMDLISRELPDLILLDVMMPGMTGLDVCTAVRKEPRTREVPIIVLSAADDSEAMIAALDAGADDFLRKPFWAPELRAKVRNVARLNRYRMINHERDRFRWLVDHSNEPVVVTDRAGVIAYANARARELFGLGERACEPIGEAIRPHFLCEPPDALQAWDARDAIPDFALLQPASEQVEACWYDVVVQQSPLSGDRILKFTDRSGWVRRELETYTFQHLIAHKIRTPLNGLGPILEFLDTTDRIEGDPELRDVLALARASADRLEDALVSVLSYHEAVFAKAVPPSRRSRAPLSALIRRSAADCGLSDALRGPMPEVEVVHPEMLEVVLTELFENFAKFSRARDEGVLISWCETPTGAELSLTAAGPQLPPALVARLGRPFWQPQRSFTGEVPGMGLGLAIARQLLRVRGGDLRLSHDAVVGGLECRLVLEAGFRATS